MLLETIRRPRSIAFVLLCTQAVLGAIFFQGPDDLPKNVKYDFIVAGGGTGGGVVAGRLAESKDWKVLVIEAGPSDSELFAARVPGLRAQLKGTNVDWNYTSTRQPALNGRATSYWRGRMLGGCSSHNTMVYTRGSSGDWDLRAKVVDDDGLSWNRMLPLLKKAEKLVKDSEHQREGNHIDPSVLGHDGPLSVTAPYSGHPMNDKFLQATSELSDVFPFVQDMNAGRPIGISWTQSTIDSEGQRSSSSTAYIDPSGDNLHVLLNTYVTRVLPAGEGTDFRGIEFASDAQSPRRQLVANKEVIVAGGVIGTPQILLNSGIGNREELEALGIKTLVNNPSVGKNFTDQPSSTVMFSTTIQNTDIDMDSALAEWNATRTGPMSRAGEINMIGWLRLPDDSPAFGQDGFTDPSPSKNSPHIEMFFKTISTQGVTLPPGSPNITALQFSHTNLHPVSRGSVTLNSSDPFAQPNIDLGLLTEEVDLAILREGIRNARKLFSAPVFANSVFGTVSPASNITSDEDLNAYLRAAVVPIMHGASTAMMSPRGANWGVVDPNFRVKRTQGLRVIDASVIPIMPSGHTQASIYGLAERASEMIAKSYK
ncbi:Choline dehydrogenase, mitochondrial [Leucoagaricus sp. SymC.cos]|nr:Choline dehydrogenase, mitochondrial [Leucoagaricus sp. SymC.cos]